MSILTHSPRIVTDGLQFCIDAGAVRSYNDRLTSLPYPQTGELTTNGMPSSFSAGVAVGWMGGGATNAEETTIVYSGSSSQKSISAGATTWYSGPVNSLAFTAGKNYRYSVWVYSATRSNPITVTIRNDSNATEVFQTKTIPQAVWTEIAGNFEASTTASAGDFLITVTGSTASDVFYFNAASVLEINTWHDLSGNFNNGTLVNLDGLSAESGAGGTKSFDFDGTNDYVQVGSLGGAGTFSNCTISVWVQNVYDAGATTYGRIYDGNYEPSIRQRGPTVQLNSPSETAHLFYLGADISNYFSAGNMTALTGEWTNIVMTVTTVGTASQSVNGYVNLNLEGTGSTTDSSKMWVGDIGNLRIGQGYKTGQRFFSGKIATMLIYNRVLSLAEIQQNYRTHKGRFGR